jgi:hypothetical protein
LTGFLPGVDQRTGAPLPNPSFQLPLTAEPTRMFVKYVDIRGHEQGPFELMFDPDAQRLESGKQILERFPHSWISVRNHGGVQLAYCTHLISLRHALREIRYAIDSESLTDTFPLPPASPDSPYDVPSTATIFVDLPAEAKFITVQLTYRDGTQSQPQRFAARPSAEQPAESAKPAGAAPQGSGSAVRTPGASAVTSQ